METERWVAASISVFFVIDERDLGISRECRRFLAARVAGKLIHDVEFCTLYFESIVALDARVHTQ